jgi:arylformamidase
VQVFYHGGYWRSFKAADFAFVAERMAEAGALVVIVNYALVPVVRIGELVRQCRAALAWVHANIAQYGGDPNRIFVSGHSAGGHLTAVMAAMESPAGEPDTRPLLQGGVSLSGLFDLEPIRLCYLQETLQLTPAEVAANSPARRLPRAGKPLILAYGADESQEFARHSSEYGHALADRGVACTVSPLGRTQSHEHLQRARRSKQRAATDDPGADGIDLNSAETLSSVCDGCHRCRPPIGLTMRASDHRSGAPSCRG